MRITFTAGAMIVLAGAPIDVRAQDAALRVVSTVAAVHDNSDSSRIIDVAVGSDGRIAVLFGDQTMKVWGASGDSLVIGGRGAQPGSLVQAVALTYGPHNRLYVFDRRLNAVSIFDAQGAFQQRASVPLSLAGVRDIAIDDNGGALLVGYAEDYSTTPIHAFCPRIDCYEGSFGSPRATRDSVAFKYFQAGHVAVNSTTVFLGHVNPFWIEAIDRKDHRTNTFANTKELEDAESIAFSRVGNRMTMSTRYPQITGLVLDGSGNLLISAFIPGRTGSFIALYDMDGKRQWRVTDPGFLAIKGQTPSGELVVLRQFGPQEVNRYRVAH